MSRRPVSLRHETPLQKPDFKPNGFWYGIHDSWVSWVKGNMPEWEGDYLYEVKVNSDKILHMSTYAELADFTAKFGHSIVPELPMMNRHCYINWAPIAERWDGIEISPYVWDARFDFIWYYGWDCASGCIWNAEKIELIELDDKAKKQLARRRH